MSELNTMIVVADASGSMREHGKAMLARNLIAHIREPLCREDGPAWRGEPVIVRWSGEAEVVQVTVDQDLPQWVVGGRLQVLPLLALLEQFVTTDGWTRVLVLSDGHFAKSDVATFKAWQRRHPFVSIRALAVGPDAATAMLKQSTDPGGVFDAEEVIGALASWHLPREQSLPVSLAEVAARAGASAQ